MLAAAGLLAAAPRVLTEFQVDGRGALVEQGVPVQPMPEADAARLVVLDRSGRPVPRAVVESEGRDPSGRVRWVRVSIVAAAGMGPYSLAVADAVQSKPRLDVTEGAGGIVVRLQDGAEYRFSPPNLLRMSRNGVVLLDGPLTFELYPDARSIINAGGKTVVLAPFEPAGFTLERGSQSRATVVLRGRSPKQKSYNSTPGNNEAKLGFDIDARFEFSALTPAVRTAWRLINRAGYKAWLERCSMILPFAQGASIADSETGPDTLLGTWADVRVKDQAVGIASPFAPEYGPGYGMQLSARGLAIGGVRLPPDGGLGGLLPEIHRLFYHGMGRTFRGWLVPGSARPWAVRDSLQIPARYYSDTGVLPERGLPVRAGEFATQVERSSRWLLNAQWRGTLWAGEWWREWDVGRQQGTEEASNGNSLLAPLYHYFRTGDRQFLQSAALSAGYVYDIQHDHKQTGFGPMMHTRRHLLDELDWIHPRYQRAMGGLLISHVLLHERERRELIEMLRNFSMQTQGEDGVPYNWDEVKNQRASTETGVDTANIIEAFVAAWEETGDAFFLDRARGYARWTLKKWRTRTDDTFWNWNLTRYVLSGMLAICRVGKEYPSQVPEVQDFLKGTFEIGRHTVMHPELTSVPGTIGGGDLHYVFYHSWLGTELARVTGDASLLPGLGAVVRRELAKQEPDGTFPMQLGTLWSQYPTRVISYYDAKSVVAYLPVLGSRLAQAADSGQSGSSAAHTAR
ncbi:MAG: hypothetical protein ABIZ80_07080 [Bryobacteraceae bacterium]